MRSWEHSGFNVFLAEPTSPENRDARFFLAHYLKRSPHGDVHRDLSPLSQLQKPASNSPHFHCVKLPALLT